MRGPVKAVMMLFRGRGPRSCPRAADLLSSCGVCQTAAPCPPARPPVNRQPLLPYVWMLLSNVTFAGMGAFAHALSRRGVDWQLTAICRARLVLVFAFFLALGARAPLVLWRPRILWLPPPPGPSPLIFPS